MLSPLLFNIYFAAVLAVALRKFSEDAVIVPKLLQLTKLPTSIRTESAMDYVRRSVWGMLYVDDACIVSRLPQRLAKMMEVIVEITKLLLQPC